VAVTDDFNADWGHGDDPLTRRLRELDWGEVPEDVRARCWAQISRRLENLDAERPIRSGVSIRDFSQRNEFTTVLTRRPATVPLAARARLRPHAARA
jgi:hypothetical protein